MPRKIGTENWRKKRRQEHLEMKEYRYYIFCEGEQTEPRYFSGFKKLIEDNPIYRDMVLIQIEPCGAETMRVIGQAERYVKENQITKGQIWCVYDKDSFPAQNFNGVVSRAESLNKENPLVQYHAAWSNECIEFWFMLHFAYYTSNNHRTEYIRFLNERYAQLGLGKYKKNAADTFDILMTHGNPRLAARYAKRIIKEHKLDTFFSSVEAYGLKHYPGLFRVEKITGSRLHMYVENDSVPKTFEIVAAVTKYAFELAGHLNVNVSKYKTLLLFCIHAGACYGPFYEFEFKRKDADEMTTIGFAANYAAKLQNMANPSRVLISENIYDSLTADQKKCFSRLTPTAIRKYDQTCCYDAEIANLPVRYNFKRDFERAVEIARKVDLQNMYFRSANQPLSYRNLSKTECKKINGIPLFADVRDFTSQFDEDGANLEEMAVKTQNILTAMYDVVEERNGIHVQFQGDREMALFHDYGDYSCVVDAVIAGLKIIDAVKGYQVSVGVGQSIGRLFAAKIGARGEKDNILLGRTVGEADKNEDEYAEKNQLVLSADLYEKLKQNDSGLSSLFKKKNGGVYYTESGYRGYLSQESRKQLKHDNAHNNYNKAWGVFVG